MGSSGRLGARTVADFGEQWTRFAGSPGYYGSAALFADIVSPLLSVEEFRGAQVAEIGSGTGRIVRMLAGAGAARITAVEPSAAMGPLRENTRDLVDRIRYVEDTGERMPAAGDLDFVVSIGVLHHIPDPGPVVRRAFAALRPGGRMLAWVYGAEGNRLYLALVRPLRALTTHLPHGALAALCRVLDVPLVIALRVNRHVELPLGSYLREHLDRLTPEVRRLTIYDQLNPAWARYYTREEARALLEDAGFVNVRLHHRHGYSWTVVGERPRA